MHEVSKAMHPGNVTVGERGLDGGLVTVPRLVFFQRGAVEESSESSRSKLHGEFARGAFDGCDADVAGSIERITVSRRTDSRGSSHGGPRSKMKRVGDPWRQ